MGMPFDWVLARHKHNTDQAKYILGMSAHGMGYHILNRNRGKTEDIIVAFKFPANRPLPLHLAYATKDQVEKLEVMDRERRGAAKTSYK